jgi:hypothetical protein
VLLCSVSSFLSKRLLVIAVVAVIAPEFTRIAFVSIETDHCTVNMQPQTSELVATSPMDDAVLLFHEDIWVNSILIPKETVFL